MNPDFVDGREDGGGRCGELLSPEAAAYAADAIVASSRNNNGISNRSSSSKRPKMTMMTPEINNSPFHDPILPKSPAWGFGEALGHCLSDPGSSRGNSRGSGGGRRGSSRRGCRGREGGEAPPVERSFGNNDDGVEGDGDDSQRAEEIELMDYTSIGRQIVSNRATSPAHAFSRDGLGNENLSMFKTDKRPEPGPGSFEPNLSATSTHAGPPCGVAMRRSGGSTGDSDGLGVAGGGKGGGFGGEKGNGMPGPGQYRLWDAIGRQILSTRPSSPGVVFATGDWEL